jgi:hypothetical protein
LLCHISSTRGDTRRRTQISSDVADFEAPHIVGLPVHVTQ